MYAISGGRGAPSEVNALPRARRRLRTRGPVLVARCERLLRLASVAIGGSHPEDAIPQLEAARRSLAVFLKLTP